MVIAVAGNPRTPAKESNGVVNGRRDTRSPSAPRTSLLPRATFKICNDLTLPSGQTVSTLLPNNSRPIPGLQKTCSNSGTRGRSSESWQRRRLLTVRSSRLVPLAGELWKWKPRCTGISPQLWYAFPAVLLRTYPQITTKRGLRGKTKPIDNMDLHVDVNMHARATGQREHEESPLPTSCDNEFNMHVHEPAPKVRRRILLKRRARYGEEEPNANSDSTVCGLNAEIT